jgi:hypothetical protein
MSFKDLGSKDIPQRVDTPEEAELRARAAARHKAKEARRDEHRTERSHPQQGEAARREPEK